MLLVLLVTLAGLSSAASTPFDERFRAGLVALQSGDLKSAELNLQAAVELAPKNGRAWVALAQTYRKLQLDKKAEDAAARAAGLVNGDRVIVESLGIYYFEVTQPLLEHEKFAEAAAVLENARRQGVRTSQIELALGVSYYGLRRFSEAAAAFLETIAIDPKLPQPYAFLGKMLDQVSDRLPELTRRFAEFEAANPGSALGYFLHAKALNAQSIEPESAQELLEKSISLDANNAAAHFELGVVRERMKHLEAAGAEFERAAALDATDPAVHYRLARVYERLGRTKDAAIQRELHGKLVKAQDSAR